MILSPTGRRYSIQSKLTLDTYSHVLPSLQEQALDRLGALLTKAGGPVAVKAGEVKGA
jgi:hypothetical protein